MSPSRRRSLKDRLVEAETTLEAIRRGEVDAIVVSGPAGEGTRVLDSGAQPYHLLLNSMRDGAALITHDGRILFGNRRLTAMAGRDLATLRGAPFRHLVRPAERAEIDTMLRDGATRSVEREFTLAGGPPVAIVVSPTPLDPAPAAPTVLMAIVTDLTDRKRAEATRRQLLERLMVAGDEERRRIARELHDEAGQSLAASLLDLRAIQEAADLNEARSAAARLRAGVSHTLENLGRLARGLHPRDLDRWGLAEATARHAEEFGRAQGIAVKVRKAGVEAGRLPGLIESTLYRVYQEAMTNVARHAHATHVTVGLTHAGGTAELLVEDNGVGFAADAPVHHAGLGLHGMRERVALLGGVIEVRSGPGEGTVIRARVPTAPA